MFWNKSKPQVPRAADEPSHTRATSEHRPSDLDAALDAVGEFLRTFGHHSFDTDEWDADELKSRCDQWVSEILVQFPSDERGPRRNWAGVRQFFRQTRQQERVYVDRSLDNLREALQTFAQCLTSAVQEDRVAEQAIEGSLTGLLASLTDKDTGRVRAEATTVVTHVREVMDKRRKREERQLAMLSQRLMNLRSELTEAKAAASLDGLTKLSNRQAFDTHVQRISDLGLLFSCPPVLMMIDVDHFKRVNDSHGHPAGDAVLREVANSLVRTFLRKQDFVARFGGEEFAVLLIDTSARSATELAERARLMVQQRPVKYANQEISVTISVGLSLLGQGQAPAEWLKRADEALYHAKASGRNCLRIAEPLGAANKRDPLA
jgi:diguanylate cyclase